MGALGRGVIGECGGEAGRVAHLQPLDVNRLRLEVTRQRVKLLLEDVDLEVELRVDLGEASLSRLLFYPLSTHRHRHHRR